MSAPLWRRATIPHDPARTGARSGVAHRMRPCVHYYKGKESWWGQVMLRSIDDPNEAFTRVEFASVEDAKEFRDRLVASRALSDAATVLTPPTVVEMVENISY